ncbi:MAG: LPS assembly lipoprotein LptE [Kiritimatiellia bacterium]
MIRFPPPLLLIACVLLSGCAGYQYGTSLPNNYRSICVKTFENKTGEPNMEFAATQSAMREFQSDGSLEISEAGTADLILQATLAEATFEAVRFAKNRTNTADEYRMTVSAIITLVNRKTGTVLIAKRKVVGETSFRSVGDSQQARLSAQPLVSQDLAHQIVKNVVEFW